MKIVVAYKWTCDPEEATVRADGTVDWSRAKPGISAYDPVAIELARRLAEAAGAELIGVTVGAKGVGVAIASKAALSRGLDRVVIVEDESLQDAGRSELAAVLAAVVRHIGDVDLVVTGDSSVDVAAKMVPTVLAGELGWPAVAEVTAAEGQAGALRVERAIPGGTQVLEISGPAVLAASADAAVPRVPGMKDLLAAGKKPVEHLELTALNVPARSAVVTVTGRSRPDRKARAGPAHRHVRPSGRRCRARRRTARRRSAVTAPHQDLRKDSTMSVSAWIVVGEQPAIGNLITVARSLGGQVGAVVAGSRPVAETVAAGGVDKVVWCGATGDVPAEAYAAAVADIVAAEPPRVVLGGRNPADRVLLGAAAARLRAAVLTGARSVSADGDGVIVVNAVFGDIADETVAVSGPVALLLDGGSAPPAGGGSVPIEEAAATPLAMKVIETRTFGFDEVDLNAAPRVIGVGRGLKAKEDLAMIEALARATGSEIACSRPVAEGLNWMGKDRYIGSSGAHIAPQLYFAVGISGQLQHMVGVQGAETIVAINSDPNAAVFKGTDYGLVGDLYQLVPAITAALK